MSPSSIAILFLYVQMDHPNRPKDYKKFFQAAYDKISYIHFHIFQIDLIKSKNLMITLVVVRWYSIIVEQTSLIEGYWMNTWLMTFKWLPQNGQSLLISNSSFLTFSLLEVILKSFHGNKLILPIKFKF